MPAARDIARRAGVIVGKLGVTAHGLRHGFAQRRYEKVTAIKTKRREVMEWMGTRARPQRPPISAQLASQTAVIQRGV